MIRVVLDTTVLVAAVISPVGPNAQVFDLVTSGKVRPYVTSAVLEEYSRVLDYQRLRHLNKRRVANVLRLAAAMAVKVNSAGRLKISAHEDDNRIYECAHAAKAHYIRHREHQAFQGIPHLHQNRHRSSDSGIAEGRVREITPQIAARPVSEAASNPA